MDPYQSPTAATPEAPAMPSLPNRGQPCLECKSSNTGTNNPLSSRPSVLWVMLGGWTFILLRTAFSTKIEACRDCGAIRRYRTTANYVAMVILGLLILLTLLAYLES